MTDISFQSGLLTQPLRDAIFKKFAVARAERIWNSLMSAYERLRFANHHLQLLKKPSLAYIESGVQLEGYVTVTQDEDSVYFQFNNSSYATKLHATDCIQHLHAFGDTLAFAVYFLSDLPDIEPFDSERAISLKLVKRRLEKNKNTLFFPLLEKLMSGGDFTYVDDFNNFSKHRSLIKPVIALEPIWNGEGSFTDGEPNWALLKFPQVAKVEQPKPKSHERNRVHVHAPRPVVPFLEAELERTLEIFMQAFTTIADQLDIPRKALVPQKNSESGATV